MAQLRDPHKFFGGLNSDDDPSQIPIGDYVGAKNLRTLSSKSQHQSGPGETLQSEIEVLINPDARLMYYGSAIGGSFVYSGYDEISVGTQVWMKKNWDAAYPGSKVYDDSEDNRGIYGGLYTHNHIMAVDFCPDGWRVPTEADMDTLLTYLGGAMIAGGKMKEVGDSHWTNPNTGAVDSSGFRAVPGGKFDLLFDLLGDNCLLWLRDEGVPVAPVALNGSIITYSSFVANWQSVEGATGYYLDVAEDAGFTVFVAGFNNKDVGNVLLDTVTGLTGATPYYYRVRAYNEIGASENSNTQSITTLFAYNDWFLPSTDELDKMYTELQLYGIGNFADENYLTSCEGTGDTAFNNSLRCKIQHFITGVQAQTTKDNPLPSRACRTFISADVYNLRNLGESGWVFHIIDNGDATFTYYECATVDNAYHDWSNLLGVMGFSTGESIGDGQANTTAIINQVGHVASAAKLCDDLVI